MLNVSSSLENGYVQKFDNSYQLLDYNFTTPNEESHEVNKDDSLPFCYDTLEQLRKRYTLCNQTYEFQYMENFMGFLSLESSQSIMSQENCEISRCFEDDFETVSKEIENCEERLVYQHVQERGFFSFPDHMT